MGQDPTDRPGTDPMTEPHQFTNVAGVTNRPKRMGRGLPTWRRSTATSCRSANTSTITTVLPRESSASHPNTRTVIKYSRRNTTDIDHACPTLTKH
jgi:hypothetical protein